MNKYLTKIRHNLSTSKIYYIWRSMRHRVLSKHNVDFKDYGGRGITICDEWKNDFVSFYNWAMSNGYEENKGLSIDRIDNNLGYSPNNCRWVTQSIQSRNQRLRKTNKTGYKGVYFNINRDNFTASIKIKYKSKHIGTFKTALEGAIAYNNYIIKNNLEGFNLNKL